MELRVLELVIRLLNPRKWRVRLAQLFGGALATAWIAGRAVDQTPILREVRDVRRGERSAHIRARNAQLEADRLRP